MNHEAAVPWRNHPPYGNGRAGLLYVGGVVFSNSCSKSPDPFASAGSANQPPETEPFQNERGRIYVEAWGAEGEKSVLTEANVRTCDQATYTSMNV